MSKNAALRGRVENRITDLISPRAQTLSVSGFCWLVQRFVLLRVHSLSLALNVYEEAEKFVKTAPCKNYQSLRVLSWFGTENDLAFSATSKAALDDLAQKQAEPRQAVTELVAMTRSPGSGFKDESCVCVKRFLAQESSQVVAGNSGGSEGKRGRCRVQETWEEASSEFWLRSDANQSSRKEALKRLECWRKVEE
eukprot:6462235-Amphidinium_carterae.6